MSCRELADPFRRSLLKFARAAGVCALSLGLVGAAMAQAPTKGR